MSKRPHRNRQQSSRRRWPGPPLRGRRRAPNWGSKSTSPQSDHPVEKQLLGGAAGVFGNDRNEATASRSDLELFHAKSGELTVEDDILAGYAYQGGIAERKANINTGHALSVKKQAEAVGIARSTVYYLPPITNPCARSTDCIWSLPSLGCRSCGIL